MRNRAIEQVLVGVAASRGIAIGPLQPLTSTSTSRVPGSPNTERCALEDALNMAGQSLRSLMAAADALAGEILEFQLMLLADNELIEPIRAQVADGVAADQAVRAVFDAEIADYRAAELDYMAARASDLTDLRDRILRILGGDVGPAGELPAAAILLADDLPPSTFLEFDLARLGGLALRQCSPTSHVAILARARGIPAVVSLGSTPDGAEPSALVVLDGDQGTLTIAPSDVALSEARARKKQATQAAILTASAAGRPAIAKSGERVTVLINVDDPAILDSLDPELCDGIGLTRTEFLFRGKELPSEDEQTRVYERILRWAQGRPVIIRNLDAGGDKPVPGLTIDGEANPFLGLRGLRLLLSKPEVFRQQLRALARAAPLGRLRIMLPMVTVPAELVETAALLDAVIAELRAEGVPCARPPLGVMIETPAAALTAASFAADFYSIGSNDLVQYVTACARDNPHLRPLADPTNPAVLELIRRTVKAGRQRAVDVSLCGDMASEPALIPILLANGVRSLSVAPAQIGSVKLAIAQCNLGPSDGG